MGGTSGLWSGASGLQSGASLDAQVAAILSGHPSAWYDPSDPNTLWQDMARTIPVTGYGQAVACIDDKSGNGNHLFQGTVARRPVWGRHPVVGRRNLFTYTEQFDDSAWAQTNVTVTPNAAIAPDGTMSADRVVPSAGTRPLNVDGPRFNTPVGLVKTLSVHAKMDTARYLALGFSNGAGFTATANFDLQTGVVTGTGFHPDAATSVQAGMTSLANGWYRCFFSIFADIEYMPFCHITASTQPAGGIYNRNITGDGVSGIFIWGAQVETGATATPYQKVVSSFDVTEHGVDSVYYLAFDGVDDSMATSGNITPGTDKAQVVGGFRKNNGTAGIVLETSTNANTNAGSLYLYANDGSANWASLSRGTATADASQIASVSVSGADTAVIATTHDIGASITTLRRNGVATANGTGDKGIGSFNAYPLYVGRRANATFPFNGRIYCFVLRFGLNLSAADRATLEQWAAVRTGVALP
jgi:hypothetical protein